MGWGGISFRGKMDLVIIPGRMTGKSYIEVCRLGLARANELYGAGNWSYQQDNAPAHTSKVAKRWFEEQGITLVSHPANSPDMNPKESIWSIMKRKVEKMEPKNVQELQDAIVESWKQVP